MKLAYLLAQYLYTNKRLDLPGIGTFKLDPAVAINTENSSKQRSATPEGISFEQNTSILDSPDLISYISSKTGKMKALAIADLESHIELAQQFLNIGKPFTFEGIGHLVKTRPGEFEFTPGLIINDKTTKEITASDAPGLSKKETVEARYQAFLATPVARSRWRKPVVALLAFCGIALAIWGGYTISTRNSGNEESVLAAAANETVPYVDSSQLNKPDTTLIQKAAVPDSYKYVLQVSKAQKAFDRFKQLKTNRWDIKMETQDSIQYKLFIVLPTSIDTTRKLDSLTALTGKKVYIEYQN
ncbi:MAG: hypothetical protein WDO16_22885 [Bacteroidota bacterium]